jgi:Uma2 family endonuclease
MVSPYDRPVVTLHEVAAMNADPSGRRYELGVDGTVSVTELPDSGHATIASRLMAWFARAGWAPEQLLQVPGIRVPGPGGDGGRIPDFTVWRTPPGDGVWLDVADLLLVVEIVSPGSEAIDQVTKRGEYARAGIPQYWVVDRDAAETVTLYRLGPGDDYVERAKMPLAWLLQTAPVDHLG